MYHNLNSKAHVTDVYCYQQFKNVCFILIYEATLVRNCKCGYFAIMIKFYTVISPYNDNLFIAFKKLQNVGLLHAYT